jgi:NADPH:quinone reductase-like Zn-dependent oxidoreductase
MRQVVITRLGGPEVLQVRESPDPAPGRGQVRVRVRAAGVNFADTLMRMGLYPGAPKAPFTPGYEACGVVDETGPDADGWKPGDRVIVPTNFGGYADTLVVPAAQLFRLPEGKSFEEGAALTVNYLTAYEALVEQGHLRSRGRVLVHGAAGGVGVAAAQVAKVFGATVFGTASASKHDFCRKHGVDRPIDYRSEDFETVIRRETGGHGVHVALDPIGGHSFRKSYRCLAPTGKLICYGFSAAAPGTRRRWLSVLWHYLRTPSFSPLALMTENRGVVGLHLGRLTGEAELLGAAMKELLDWWQAGKLSPVVGATFPLELAAKAHEYLQGRGSVGKVVLTAGGSK